MNRQARKVFLIWLCFVLLFSLNFKQTRKPTEKNPPIYSLEADFPSLNEGLPFKSRGPAWSPDYILVKFKPALDQEFHISVLSAYNLSQIKRIPVLNIYRAKITASSSVKEMVYILNQNPDVAYAEPDYKAYIAVTPNDPFFQYQYSLYNKGQEIGIPGSPSGKSRADIKATESWEETKGDPSVVIAIIDTGIDFNHPDLMNKIHSSGYDFVNDDSDPTDDQGHGTHVAGIAAAETNNNEGIAGVSWNCTILPLKVMDAQGEGYYSWMIEAIRYAVDNGASVINFSLGGDQPSQALEEGLRYAVEKKVVIVAAAGNEADSVLYPAAYDSYCLAVASSDYNDQRSLWSNFGPEVDVTAPGERILSCVPLWYWGEGALPYGFGFGTSMAVPHVAGLAALIKAIKPWMTPQDIMNVIRYTSDDINKQEYPGKDEYIGYGRINMEKALVPIKITGD